MQKGKKCQGDVDVEKSVLSVEDCGRDSLVLGHSVTWEERVGAEGGIGDGVVDEKGKATATTGGWRRE